MKNTLTYDTSGLQLTESEEGLKLAAYQDSGAVWTIGYGHTPSHAGEIIDVSQAQTLLLADVQSACLTVNNYVNIKLTQPQFDALVDFVFNVGATAFRTSTLLMLLNSGAVHAAENQLLRWDKCKGLTLSGLLARRKSEMLEFSNV